jgi:hypothetical protein
MTVKQARRWLSSGMLCRVIWYILTDVSEGVTASMNKEMRQQAPLKSQRVYIHLHAQVLRRQPSLYLLLREPEIPVVKQVCYRHINIMLYSIFTTYGRCGLTSKKGKVIDQTYFQ